jgi:hypothetical protein
MRFPVVVLHLVLERRNTVTKNISERISVKLKQTREDPWLFFGGGAVVVLLAVLTIVASALRVPEGRIGDEGQASTAVSIPRRNLPVPSFAIEQRGPSAATAVAPR